MILLEFQRESLATGQWLNVKEYPSQELAFEILLFLLCSINNRSNRVDITEL